MAGKAVMSITHKGEGAAMNSLTIIFFATLHERAGVKSLTVQMSPGATLAELRTHLCEILPGLQPVLGIAVAAVNHEFAFDTDILPDAAEIAFFPPVSGGAEPVPTICSITDEAIDLDALVAAITLPSTGAACVFSGMVRAETQRGQAHETQYLEYEAYQPMAEAKMRQVAQEIRQRWPTVQGLALVQRIGRLYPGTPTVLIACTAAHRDTGVFEAARYGIDRLKEIVPVWKKEVGPLGEAWVEGEYLPGEADRNPHQ